MWASFVLQGLHEQAGQWRSRSSILNLLSKRVFISARDGSLVGEREGRDSADAGYGSASPSRSPLPRLMPADGQGGFDIKDP